MDLQGVFTRLIVIIVTLLVFINATGVDHIVVDTQNSLCEVNPKFLSIAIDTSFVFKYDLRVLLKTAAVMNMFRGLQPAYLRVGGTAADLVVFDKSIHDISNNYDSNCLSLMESLSWSDEEDKSCVRKSRPILHMSRDLWLAINLIATEANLNLLYDLNVLIRKTSGEWDPSNAQKLIAFSQGANLSLDWQLGNEPNSFGHVFGEELPPTQLARDYKTLHKILSKFPLYRKSKLLGPDITSPRGPKKRQILTLRYLDKFLSKAKNTVDAVTWHQYYVNGRNATVEDFMNPSIFDVLKREIIDVKSVVVKNTNKYFPVWITETASAFGGGAPHLSDRFVSGFMFLDKLGMTASYNISVVMRQSLIGGNYALIDVKSLEPNPNFWISYLYKKIVGQTVLKIQTTHHNPFIRLYAHCYKGRGNSIVIFGMNLSPSDYKGLLLTKKDFSNKLTVEEYILTSADGQMTSSDIQLNGKVLKMTEQLPPVEPVQVKGNLLRLPPHSMGFYVVSGIPAPACG